MSDLKVKWIPNPLLISKKLYLAGPITGLSYGETTDWRDQIIPRLHNSITAYSPMRAKYYLENETSISDNQKELTHHSDIAAAFSSDKGIIRKEFYDICVEEVQKEINKEIIEELIQEMAKDELG